MEYERLLMRVLSSRSPLASGARFELPKGELAAAVAAESRIAARSRARRSKDPRIRPHGPALTLTLAIGANGRRIALDLDMPDVEVVSQIVEYRPDGTIVHVAERVAAWLEGLG
jgi:hypothetical protein